MNQAERDALIRHGYPLLPARGVSGPPGEVIDGFDTRNGKCVSTLLRNRVCYLDGIEIDGHRSSDLDPRGSCIHCGHEIEDEW